MDDRISSTKIESSKKNAIYSMFEFLEFDPLNASVYAKQHVWTFLAQEQAAYRERRDGSCVFLKDLEG